MTQDRKTQDIKTQDKKDSLMTQYPHLINALPKGLQRSPFPKAPSRLLVSSVTAVGTVAMLSGGIGWSLAASAQAADPTIDSGMVAPAPIAPTAGNAAPLSVAAPEATPTAPSRSSQASSVEPAPRAIAPTLTGQAGARPEPNQDFIDPTGYNLGATQRTSEMPVQAARLRLNQPGSVAPLSTVGGIGQLPSLKDFYYRTVRPSAQLGNGNVRLIFPLSIPAAITSAFGWRIHPITGDQRFHAGTDIGAPMGTPVLAAYAGRVAIADFLGGYGLTVTLEHTKGTQQTLYGHLSEIFVKPGEWVEQGMVIGRLGSTGNSTGPHLHFEFRQLTPDGWMAMDAGTQLEYALAQLILSLQLAQGSLQPGLKTGIDLGQVNLGAQG